MGASSLQFSVPRVKYYTEIFLLTQGK